MQRQFVSLNLSYNIMSEESPYDKEFHAIEDKFSREYWLQEKLEKILVLSHRAMNYWDTHYSSESDDSVFFEEVTDITMEIRELSEAFTSLGAYHADCLLFDEFDESGKYSRDK
jgi:hypothetical protein